MTIEATGQVLRTERGRDLVLLRSVSLPAEEAWEFLTKSELTEQWFGAWDGDGRLGGSIRIRMKFEEGEPPVRAKILGCDAPNYLAFHVADEYGSWQLELFLDEDGEHDSLLRFVHHLGPDDNVGEVGPGWEYYLDLFVAATESTERPEFDQYYPALSAHYLEQRP